MERELRSSARFSWFSNAQSKISLLTWETVLKNKLGCNIWCRRDGIFSDPSLDILESKLMQKGNISNSFYVPLSGNIGY